MGAAKHNELLDYLAKSVCVVLSAESTLSQEEVQRVVEGVQTRLASVWANNWVYIPKQMHCRNLLRYQQIFADFDGGNHPALSQKYGLSIQRIYAIIKKMKVEHVKQHQRMLFPVCSSKKGGKNAQNKHSYQMLEDIIVHTSSCLQTLPGFDSKYADALGKAIADHLSQHHHGLCGYIPAGAIKQKEAIKQGPLFDMNLEN
ncbi:hypothetical protein CE195_07415 [Sodalis-like symbiont of Philaenus spumarius]|nr:hypothetical protein CE195_07415 [Sodalis-like symbiont of Philaenus spumarius]